MELRHLRYFVAVAEEGGFSSAARRLHVVQPTLSMQIKALEDELGGPLFDRGPRSVQLTAAGVAFLSEARRVLALSERAKATARLVLGGETGSVRIGFSGATVFGGVLTDCLRSYHETYPRVRIELQEASPTQQHDSIRANELDVGYSASPEHGGGTGLRAEPVYSADFLLALPSHHPLAVHDVVPAEALRGPELIGYATGTHEDPIPDALRARLGLDVEPTRHRAGSTLSVLELVAAGVGIALVPDGVDRIAVPSVVYRALSGFGAKAEFSLVHRTDETNPAVVAFLETARGPKATVQRHPEIPFAPR
ncbi:MULTISPECIES: LysR family transcriptional regulator [unclassified Amycolatopsis]|uniref:LysR family transcriptional regulator n=1 Tax=unclassified Amycolatopsis TaxID=2618356 RepID=UPI001C69D2BE|nr:LysR substrate-binding domain-containing protein [Amycolatopsis sp. DSM 110486]QYN26565.1 LysR family transcriptional regulator [Amycolatopsis sp. DSM 110486]